MTMMFAARILWVLTVVAPVVQALQPTRADAQGQAAAARRAPTYERRQEKIKAWTVGLAAADAGRSEPMLVGMFVDGTRRRGVGVALVESVVGWPRGG